MNEAEAYEKLNAARASMKRQHQLVQFSVSLALTAACIIATCAASGSVVPGLGTLIGTAIGIIGAATTVAIDVYYEKVEFYVQNEEEFRKQYRVELKEAILQCTASEEWNLNPVSRAHAFKNQHKELGKESLTTTTDAWRALVWQEEYEKNNYEPVEDAVIDKRMEYIDTFTYPNKTSPEYKLFVSAIQRGEGIKMLERILADSKLYVNITEGTVDDYKKRFKEKLQTDNPDLFKFFEDMRSHEPYQFMEIYYGVKNFESVVESVKDSYT